MSFMQRQITDKRKWFEIDGNCGTFYVDVEDLPELLDAKDGEGEFLLAVFEEYYEGNEIWTVTITEGYGARLSAPGYLDCTEWSVFGTVKEAEEYLDEYYPEDEDEE